MIHQVVDQKLETNVKNSIEVAQLNLDKICLKNHISLCFLMLRYEMGIWG